MGSSERKYTFSRDWEPNQAFGSYMDPEMLYQIKLLRRLIGDPLGYWLSEAAYLLLKQIETEEIHYRDPVTKQMAIKRAGEPFPDFKGAEVESKGGRPPEY